MREQLIRTEKHMAISRKVTSVTHEINNPLQTIQNYMYLAEQEVPPNSEIREYFDNVTFE
jgi:phosphoglycerate-specific signal transduction histidine kinase